MISLTFEVKSETDSYNIFGCNYNDFCLTGSAYDFPSQFPGKLVFVNGGKTNSSNSIYRRHEKNILEPNKMYILESLPLISDTTPSHGISIKEVNGKDDSIYEFYTTYTMRDYNSRLSGENGIYYDGLKIGAITTPGSMDNELTSTNLLKAIYRSYPLRIYSCVIKQGDITIMDLHSI